MISPLRRRVTAATIVVTATISIARPATGQQLITDLNTTPPLVDQSSDPHDYATLGNVAVFAAHTPGSGREPWVTDGTAAGTLRLADLVPGRMSSDPDMHARYGGEILFSTFVPIRGGSIFYLTDGTSANTREIPPFGVTGPATFHALQNGNLLVSIAGGSTLATDLTTIGTQTIPGLTHFAPVREIGGELWGTGFDPATNTYSLWATDGTVVGSRQIAAGLNGRIGGLAQWNGRVYFVEPAPGFSLSVTSTDGIAGITRHVSITSSAVTAEGAALLVRNNRLITSVGGQLFVTDLTPAGTASVALPCTGLGHLHEHNGTIYLRGRSATTGSELWTTDGTVAGTALVADLEPGAGSSAPAHILVQPNGVFFRAMISGSHHLMLCTGPTAVQNLGPLPTAAPGFGNGTNDSEFVPFVGGVLFSGTSNDGREPWFGSASQAPTQVANIAVARPGILEQVQQQPIAAARDRLFFGGRFDRFEAELVSTDGTANGTHRLDLMPNPGYARFDQLARFGGRCAFSIGALVGATDGTAVGTSLLVPGSQGATTDVAVDGDRLYYRYGDDLFVSDGTVAGTQPIPTGGPIDRFHLLPNRIVLNRSRSLLGTDGASPPVPLTPGYVVGRLGDLLVWVDDTTAPTPDIGITDGTPAGTTTLLSSVVGSVDLATAASPTSNSAWIRVGSLIHRLDRNGIFTPVATAPANLDELVATRNELFAVARDAATGAELWRLDQLAGQFVRVTDIAPGPTNGVARAWQLGDGDLLFLSAGTTATGAEPWISNGSSAGTVPLNEIAPGADSSNPGLLGIANGTIYFLADDGVHGREIYRAPLAITGAAFVDTFGSGCIGSGGVARLATANIPAPGTNDFELALDRVRPTSLAALTIGFDSANAAPGCQVLVSSVVTSVLRTTNLAGRATLTLALPGSSAIVGTRFTAQGFTLDPLAPSGFVGSNGVIAVVGR